MTENEPGLDPSHEDARITSLEERLQKAKSEEDIRTGKPSEGVQLVKTAGTRILSDLVGIPLGSAVIGFVVDQWLKTGPWVMLGMLFLGFGIGVRSVMRDSKQSSE